VGRQVGRQRAGSRFWARPVTPVMLAVMVTLLVAGLSGCAGSSKTSSSGAASVPLTLGRAGHIGAVRPVVMVSVGGGLSVPVLLDTGSSGLRILASAVGPDARPTGTATHAVHYSAVTLQCNSVRASVTLGGGPGGTGVTTQGPILVDTIAPSTDPATVARFSSNSGVRGILGIAPSVHHQAAELPSSPLPQLPAPLSQGYTLRLPSRLGGAPGALLLGRPSPAPGTITVAMTRAPGTFPDGRPAYAKDVNLCWAVGQVRACGATNLDTGTDVAEIASTALTGAPQQRSEVPAGIPVVMSTPSGAALWSVTAAPTPATSRVKYSAQFPPTQFNSGIDLFLAHTVGWDLVTGQVLITPTT
jgi:hypothetical protein